MIVFVNNNNTNDKNNNNNDNNNNNNNNKKKKKKKKKENSFKFACLHSLVQIKTNAGNIQTQDTANVQNTDQRKTL